MILGKLPLFSEDKFYSTFSSSARSAAQVGFGEEDPRGPADVGGSRGGWKGFWFEFCD